LFYNVLRHIIVISTNKSSIVPNLACNSSGIIIASLVNFKNAIYDKFFTTEQHVFMNLRHEVHISSNNDAFTNSRLALKKLLELKGHQVLDLKTDLALLDFQNLPKYPEYLISLSHTKGAGASVLALKQDYLSLGIDIEWSDRHFKAEAQKFLRHPEDSMNDNLLELWTMKEAAFKALSPLGFPGVLVLSKIIIQNGEFWTNEKKEVRGKVETLRLPANDRELCLSIAAVLKSTL